MSCSECEHWRRMYHHASDERDALLRGTRKLDVNDDAMVLFLEAAKRQGFAIQLVPVPQSVI